MSRYYIDGKSALVKVIAWCREAILKPLAELMLSQIYVAIWRH